MATISKTKGSWKFPEYDNLEEAVKRFFEIMDKKEESDSGREFRPNVISSCRVYDTAELESLLPQMKELANK